MKLNDRQFKDELTKTWFIVGLVVGGLMLAVVPLFIFFGKQIAYGGNQCAFLTLTHLYCPGCGGTRAVRALLSGHIIKSFIYHPFVPYCVIMWLVYEGSHLLEILHVPGVKGMKFREAYAYVGIGILLCNWIIKNIMLFVINGLH